jgi:hypothetical protein
MKRLLLVCLLALPVLYAQAVFTPPVPPSGGSAGKLSLAAGTSPNNLGCIVNGNAVPATALVFNCSIGATVIPQFTMQFPSGTAFTFQFNFGGHAITAILQQASAGVTVSATADGGTPVTGTF